MTGEAGARFCGFDRVERSIVWCDVCVIVCVECARQCLTQLYAICFAVSLSFPGTYLVTELS